ncbi:MAG: hypothetical protein WA966_09690 [Ornithinimicrobium sp.]
MPTEPEYGERAESSGLSGLFGTLFVVGAVIAGFVAFHPAYDVDTFRRIFTDLRETTPTAGQVRSGEGSFAFAMTQRDGVSPVGFDPCQPIEIVVNPLHAPRGYAEMVSTAVERTSAASGLTLTVIGETDDRNFSERGPGEPAIVAWADEAEVPDLAGDVRGIGGSTSIQQWGERRYVSGMVVIDTEGATFDLGGRVAQAVLDHEFAHLVGLGHVDDSGELMNPQPTRLSYGPGDLEGLALLGAIECR